MKPLFSTKLTELRTAAKLTNYELARIADVPESMIAGIQSGRRRVGEHQARKLGTALRFSGEALEQFILHAIDTSEEKILNEAKPYPAVLLNLLARQLNKSGVCAEAICDCRVNGDLNRQDVTLNLNSGRQLNLTTQLNYA